MSEVFNDYQSALFASSSFSWNSISKRINDTAQKDTRSNKSVEMTLKTKSRPSTCVSKVSRHSRRIEKQVVSGTKNVVRRRSPKVIHASIFGTNKPYITRNNKVSASNTNRCSSFDKTTNSDDHLTSAQQDSQLFDHMDSNDRTSADGFVPSNSFNEDFMKKERGQMSFDLQRKKEGKKDRPAFSRVCLLFCCFCCLIATILIGTPIAALVLFFTSSKTTTESTTMTTATTTTITTSSTGTTTSATSSSSTTTSASSSTSTTTITTSSTSTTTITTSSTSTTTTTTSSTQTTTITTSLTVTTTITTSSTGTTTSATSSTSTTTITTSSTSITTTTTSSTSITTMTTSSTTITTITTSSTQTTTITTSSTATTTITTSSTQTTTSTSETTRTSTSTTSVATICSTTAITTTVTSSPLPPQCSNYTLNTDATRNAAYTVAGGTCDNLVFTSSPMWVRFSGAAGTMLATCPVLFSNCNTNAAGWYSGVYPSIAGDTTDGTVCYTRPTYTCIYNNTISVTNCNGYYVFALTSSPRCSLRYCTI